MPPPIDDPVFGRLEWDGDDALVGEFEYHPGQPVSVFVTFDPEESGDLDRILTGARTALNHFRAREGIHRRSGTELNAQRWNREDKLSDEDVANLLLVASFEFRSDGETHVYWNDHDLLFWGHNVITVIDRYGRFHSAGMQ